MKNILFATTAVVLFSSCAIVRPGEVGIRQQLGKLGTPKPTGIIGYNPFVARVVKIPTRTINRELNIQLPSKEGLTVTADISILYRIDAQKVNLILNEIGLEYDQIITAVFRSASADVTSKFFAKDMHSGEREQIEKEISKRMNALLNEKGFIIESVLMKSISLPPGLSKAIEEKLEAEQNAQRMEFVLQSEQREAERKLIEAKGTRDAQLVLSEGLTDKILQLRQIEMMRELSKSPNSKIIFGGSSQNILLD